MAESPTMEVRARLTADHAEFVRGMERAASSTEQFIGSTSKLKSTLIGVGTVAAVASTALIAFATKSFMAAARVDELDVALQAVGKSTGFGYTKLNDTALAIKSMGIEMEVAQRSTLKFAQNNLDLAKAADVARVAQDLAVIGGVNSTDAYDRLTQAIITGRSEILKTIGIQKSAGQMYAEYGSKIGKAAGKLTFMEKQAAVLNGVLEEGARVAGTYELAMTSPGKVLRSFARLHNEIQVAVGNVLMKGFGPLIVQAYATEKAFSKLVEKSQLAKDIFTVVGVVIAKLTKPFTDVLIKIEEMFKKITDMNTSLGGIKDKVTGFSDGMQKIGEKIQIMLPPLAALLAGFSAFAGSQLLTQVPILGRVFAGLGGPIGIAAVAFAALFATSNQFRSAIVNLLSSLKPLLPVIQTLGGIVLTSAGYAVAIFAKAIDGVAAIIRTSISLYQRFSGIINLVATMVLFGVAAFYAYKIALAAQVAITTVATAVTGGFATAMSFLNAVLAFNPLIAWVIAIGAFVGALVYAWNNSETFREVVTNVFNAVAGVIGKVIGFILRGMGNLLIGFAELFDTHKTFGKVVATVINFVIRAWVLMVTQVITQAANIIKIVATVVWVIENMGKVFFNIAKAIVGALAAFGKGVFGIFRTVANGIADFLQSALNTVIGWVRAITSVLMGIPLVGKMISGMISGMQSMTNSFSNTLRNLGGSLSDALFGNAEAGANKSIDAISKVSSTLISAASGWGNYKDGAAGALSGIANSLLKFNQKLVDATANNDIGTAVLDAATNTARKAGNFLIGLAGSVESFTSGNVFAKITGAVGSLTNSLKEALGFGDILAAEAKKAKETTTSTVPGATGGSSLASQVSKSADQLQKIRDAMQKGIESIKGVLDDLQQAAKDFANSLKDTIVNFAGLKGVELPDGFIPKAKSLIDNMKMRLDKSQQFASQIAELQVMGLDASALKSIIEEGPIKGAQLAASILSGGAEAVKQVSDLQKAITFTGAAIGQYGAEAGYSDLIATAQEGYNQIAMASMNGPTARGNNIYIEQGSFQVVVDTSKAKDADEATGLVIKKIEETFAVLAKQLASK